MKHYRIKLDYILTIPDNQSFNMTTDATKLASRGVGSVLTADRLSATFNIGAASAEYTRLTIDAKTGKFRMVRASDFHLPKVKKSRKAKP